jgi:PAS domain S-box-containing protein
MTSEALQLDNRRSSVTPMSSPDPTAVVAADTEGTIREWSPALADLFGYTAAEATGCKVDLIVPHALRGRHWNGFDKAMKTGRLKRDGKPFTVVGLHKNARLVPIRAMLELTRSDDGTVTGAKSTILGRAPAWIAPVASAFLALPGVRKPAPDKHA